MTIADKLMLIAENTKKANTEIQENRNTITSMIERDITTIKIPKGTTKIGAYTFAGCSELTEYDFSNCDSIPVLEDDSAFLGINSTAKIIIPSSLYKEWLAREDWKNYIDYIPKEESEGLEFSEWWDGGYSVDGIGTCTDREIIIPSEYNGLPVKAVNSSAFQNNTNITKVVFGSSINYIDMQAFDGCTNCLTYDFSQVKELPYLYYTSFGGSGEDDPFYVVYPLGDPASFTTNTKIIIPASLSDKLDITEGWHWYTDYVVTV